MILNNEQVARAKDRLAMWLHEAKAAHAKYEAEYGPDADWPEWYADFIVEGMQRNVLTAVVDDDQRIL